METSKGKLQEELQRTMIDLEAYKRKFESVNQQMQMIEAALIDLDGTITAINTLKNEKTGNGFLVSLGSGFYSKAAMRDNKRIIMNIGAGVSIEKTIDDASKTLETRRENLNKFAEELQKNASEMSDKMSDLNAVYEDLARSLQEG